MPGHRGVLTVGQLPGNYSAAATKPAQDGLILTVN